MGEIVASYLEAVGIKVNQIPLEYGEFRRQYYEPSMGPTYQWGLLFGSDPHQTLYPFRPGMQYYRWPDNPRQLELIQMGRNEMDLEKRAKIYQEIHQMWNDDPIAIYLIVPNDLYAIRRTVVGFVPDAMQLVDLRQVDLVE